MHTYLKALDTGSKYVNIDVFETADPIYEKCVLLY